jgi:hypothetical protein
MKQFILDKHEEIPKEVFVTLMKSLDVDTFYDVVYTLKTKAKKERNDSLRINYFFDFKWSDDDQKRQGIESKAVSFFIPEPPYNSKWISFQLQGEALPKGTVVWLAVDLQDRSEMHYYAHAERTQSKAYEILTDGYIFDFYGIVKDRKDDIQQVKSELMEGRFYAERFAILEVKLP